MFGNVTIRRSMAVYFLARMLEMSPSDEVWLYMYKLGKEQLILVFIWFEETLLNDTSKSSHRYRPPSIRIQYSAAACKSFVSVLNTEICLTINIYSTRVLL
ncbi:hypothetical protein GCK32_013741 [Trichostrongylus colubriformis]|uniref:Uncharacterized protein n=1 Tax=Trichostrongylus colubriformis TaxID=6319 RepID=A0AAN8FMS2_TRICO